MTRRRCIPRTPFAPPGLRGLGVLAYLATSCILFGQAIPHSVSIEPDLPRSGEPFSVTILLPGVQARTVEAREPAAKSEFELISISVASASQTGREASVLGTRVVYSFQTKRSGELRIPSMELRVSGASLSVGPMVIEVLPAPGASPVAPYAWRAPASVMLWQCFSASLNALSFRAPRLAASSLPAPRGVALEAYGPLEFVGMALEEGVRSLPTVKTPEGALAAEPRPLRVTPAPPEISRSRAVGRYSARLLKPAQAEILPGETMVLRVEVRGRGNLPIVEPPKFRIERSGALEGEAYDAPTLPISEIHIAPGAYEGMVGRELRFTPRAAGAYTIETEPFAFWNPESGRLEAIRFTPFRILVVPASSPILSSSRVDPLLKDALERYGAVPGFLGEAASQVRAGDLDGAARSLADRETPEALHLKGLVLLRKGGSAEALAALAAAERKNRFLPGLTEALALTEEMLGMGPHARDGLPEPRIFLVAAAVLLALGCLLWGGAFLARVGRTSNRAPMPWLRRAEIAILLLALASLLFSAFSTGERRTVYAVVVEEDARSVPSEAGSAAGGRFRGRSGKVIASSGGWTCLRFPDGQAAWFQNGTYISY